MTKWANGVRPRHPLAVGGAWASRDQRGSLAMGPMASPTGRGTRGLMATLASLSHSHVLQPYLGYPNSDFESVFRLQIMTPSRTTKTMKL